MLFAWQWLILTKTNPIKGCIGIEIGSIEFRFENCFIRSRFFALRFIKVSDSIANFLLLFFFNLFVITFTRSPVHWKYSVHSVQWSHDETWSAADWFQLGFGLKPIQFAITIFYTPNKFFDEYDQIWIKINKSG